MPCEDLHAQLALVAAVLPASCCGQELLLQPLVAGWQQQVLQIDYQLALPTAAWAWF